jgi:hypothetical protein
MTIDKNDLINSIMESFGRIEHIKAADIPNIDLYMDQVTTFMDHKLKSSTRNPKEDKILTKTMINNYAKNNLLPPPDKKKYSKEHILVLIFIYYYKNILSINDIQTLLKPLTDQYFHKDKNFSMEQIYEEVFRMEDSQKEDLKRDVLEKYQKASTTFEDSPEEEKDFLHIFSFICMLSFDVYVKKMLIEKLIDNITKEEPKKKPEESK